MATPPRFRLPPPPPSPEAEPLDVDGVRSTLDRAESGAPAAGHAVRDLFSTDEIFQRLVATADEEFVRSNRLLFLSGLAAGLSIGLTLMARSAATAAVDGGAGGLVGNLLYPVGFLLIVLGRYQLFTENTLTPVTLVLTRIAAVPQLLRVWGVVLLANVIGAALVALLLARTAVLDPDSAVAARAFGLHGVGTAWSALFWKAVIAGWLVASMVWLNHAARDTVSRFLIVFFIMYIIPSADLFHCITGACEVFYLIFVGEAGAGEFSHFFSAVVLGNTVGGVLLVAILNYAQTRRQRFPYRDCDAIALTWREWLFGIGRGKEAQAAASQNAPLTRDESVEGAETGSMLDQPVRADADGEGSEPVGAR